MISVTGMKRRTISVILSVVLAVCICNISLIALAGSSRRVLVTDSSISNVLDTKTWLDFGEPNASGGKVRFDATSEDNARIVAIQKVDDVSADGVARNLEADYTLTIRSIPSGARFALFFGLSGLTAEPGDSGSTEIAFTDLNGELAVGVSVYNDSGKTDIVAAKSYAGLQYNTAFSVSVAFEGDKILADITPAGGEKIALADSDTAGNQVSAEGYFGVGQAGGKTNAELSSVHVVAWSYDNAATPDIVSATENFDSGNYNQKVWYSFSERDKYYDAPCGIFVEDGRLVFRRLESGYFGTAYRYSNFELTFDVVSVQRRSETGEDGAALAQETGSFGVSLGNDSWNGRETASISSPCKLMLWYDGTVRYFENGMQQESVSISNTAVGNMFLPANEGQIFTFKFRMENGTATLSGKKGNGEFVELYRVTSDVTPYGYVRILSGKASNIQIDNVSIENLDANGSKTPVEFEANVLPGAGDFPYEDKWSDEDLIPWAK